MIFAVIMFLLCACFYIIRMKGNQIEPAQKTINITNGITKVMFFLPVLAVALFTVLFCTVLRGRLIERSSHAIIVFMLWIYGTSYYVSVLKYFKNRTMLLCSILGFIVSIIFAIMFTSLDRYTVLMFDSIHEASFVLGGIMLVLWYISNLKYRA